MINIKVAASPHAPCRSGFGATTGTKHSRLLRCYYSLTTNPYPQTMENNKTNSPTLTCSKDFDAPVAALYTAWTDEAALKQWWQPMDNTLQSTTADIRPGGEVRYVFTAEGDQPSIEISGTYSVAEPQKKLEYSWNWKLPNEDAVGDADFQLSVSFEEAGSGSRLSVVQTGFTDEASVQPHKEGWDKGLESLKAFLESGAAGGEEDTNASESKESTEATARSGGYNESPEQVKVGGAQPE